MFYHNLIRKRWIVLLPMLWANYEGVTAFVVQPIAGKHAIAGSSSSSASLTAASLDAANAVADIVVLDQTPTLVVSSALDVIKTVAIVVGGIIAVILALTVVFSTWVIPAAAKQLEQSTKELDPDLWDEYASKLEAGETLAMRPDLMQELGQKMNKLMAEEMDQMAEAASAQEETVSTPKDDKGNDVATSDLKDTVVDAEILPSDDKKTST